MVTCSGGQAQMNMDVKPRAWMYPRYACTETERKLVRICTLRHRNTSEKRSCTGPISHSSINLQHVAFTAPCSLNQNPSLL